MTIASARPNNQLAQTSLISAIAGWVAWVLLQFFNFTLGILLSVVTFGISGMLCTVGGYLVVVPWLIAVVAGHKALSQVSQTGESGGKAMAIIGLVLGYGGLVFTICTVVLYFAGVLTLITAVILAPTSTPFTP